MIHLRCESFKLGSQRVVGRQAVRELLVKLSGLMRYQELKVSIQDHTKHPGWYVDFGSREHLDR